jgi:hypothetical protein
MKFGPYDRTTFATKSPRILVAFPSAARGKVEAFLKGFRDGLGANSRGFVQHRPRPQRLPACDTSIGSKLVMTHKRL